VPSRTWRATASEIQCRPARQRDLLVLRIFLGMSLQETAQILGTTPGAARVAQHKALAWLRTRVTGKPLGSMVPKAPRS